MKLLTKIFLFDALLEGPLGAALESLKTGSIDVSEHNGLRAIRVETALDETDRLREIIASIAPEAIVNRSYLFDPNEYNVAPLLRIIKREPTGSSELMRVGDDGRDVLFAGGARDVLLQLGATEEEFIEFGRWWRAQPSFVLPQFGSMTTGILRENQTAPDNGFFESLSEPVQLAYDSGPSDDVEYPPMMRTWERFGSHGSLASPLIVVSQRAFQALMAIGAERVNFEPVAVGQSGSSRSLTVGLGSDSPTNA